MSRSRPPKVRAANSCRNHGGCPWCEGNRTHANRRREPVPFSLAELESCADYVYSIRAQSMFDDEDFAGWEDHLCGGTLRVSLLDAARVR